MAYTNRQELTFDPWDQATLTNLINRPIETRFEGISSLGENIAPLLPVNTREVSVQAREIYAFGAGQFRAPDATPPLVELDAKISESKMELVLLDEMRRIKEEQWMNLQSGDARIRDAAGVGLIETGQILALRNRRLTEKLRWEAFSGEATVVYNKDTDSEVEFNIDYGIPSSNKVNANVAWDDHANSDPINDLKKWLKLPTKTVGYAGTKIHLSSEAWDHLIKSESLKDYLTGSDRGLYIATAADVQALLPAGVEIIIDDSGYREEATKGRNKSDIERYLPINKVLITTDYSIDGERIADMPDGLVSVTNSFNSVNILRGPAAEVILDPMAKVHYLRYASARIPRINHPGAFVWAGVGNFSE